jgi:hypothetical protein
MVVIQGVYYDISYIHILNLTLVYPLHYSLSSLALLLKMTSADFNVPYSFMYGKCLNHTTLLYSLYLPFPSHFFPPLNMTCFTFLSFIV